MSGIVSITVHQVLEDGRRGGRLTFTGPFARIRDILLAPKGGWPLAWTAQQGQEWIDRPEGRLLREAVDRHSEGRGER